MTGSSRSREIQIHAVTKRFGGVVALNELSLDVFSGEILGIIGPNGSGKTTLFNVVTGLDKLDGGKILWGGDELRIDNRAPWDIASLGIARTFQTPRLFSQMSVLANVLVGCNLHRSRSIASRLRSPWDRVDESPLLDDAVESVEFVWPPLVQKLETAAASLAYADRRRLEIARALALRPKVIMLDEPAAGMNREETEQIVDTIHRIRERGISVVVIEHDMSLVAQADRVVAIDYGKKLCEGSFDAVRKDPRVVEAYLGRPMEK